MPVIINKTPAKQRQKPQRGHSSVLELPDLTSPGFLYRGHLMGLFGVSHTTLGIHIQRQIIPPPDGRMGTKPYWKKSTILAFLDK